MFRPFVSVDHAAYGTLIAAVPAILRFAPTDSLVVVGFTGVHPGRAVFGMRVDLPMPCHYPAVLDQLRGVLSVQEPDAVAIIVIGGDHRDAKDDDLPHRGLVRGCSSLARDLGLSLLPPLWVAAIEAQQVWLSYPEPGRFGTVPEPRTSAVSLAAVVGGDVTYENRDAFSAQLSPDPPVDLDRRARTIGHLPPVVVQDAIALVRDATEHVTDPNSSLDEETIARLGQGLAHPRVRDVAISLAVTDSAEASELLWVRLTRALPRPHLSHAATLLAIVTYLRGNGALAGVALEIALDADPTNVLAALVRAALHNGVPPHQLKDLLATAVSESSPKSA